jgi:type IV secretory pathway protease TraF
VPLVKRVAAAPGSDVCAREARILIDDKLAAIRLRRDPHGREMPWWQGCERLRAGRVFLLTQSPTSFDGRYFGPVSGSQVIGRATPLWVR